MSENKSKVVLTKHTARSTEDYMQRCLFLARQGEGHVAPNPMVGALIVYNNEIIGEGYHHKYGQAHAEPNAINSVKKHQKPNPSTGATGGIINKEMSIHISNVAIYNFTSKRADRVGFRFDSNDKKVRFFKATNELIEV